jgi:ribosomal protein S18 acetylase RimI-like enzyme
MKTQPRPYGPSDLAPLLGLIQRAWGTYNHRTYFHVGDLCWRMCLATYEAELLVWEDEAGHVVGFTEFDGKSLELQISPDCQGHGIERQMLAWAERHVIGAEIKTWASETDTAWIAALSEAGYRRNEGWFNHHFQSLGETVEAPRLPEGFVVRCIREDEIDKRIEVHRAAWQGSTMDHERYHRLMSMPAYRMDLDVVAVAPDGRFASCTNVWLDDVNGVGLFEPVGTDPDFRRMGLGRAVITEGLKRLRDLGADRALVLSWNKNEASTKLYESCGMRTERRDYPYIKQVSVGNLSAGARV